MDELKRRDLLNYFEDKRNKNEEEIYSSLSQYNCNEFINFIIKDDILNKSNNEIEREVYEKCSSILDLKYENFLARANCNYAIDIILQTYLEVYEHVCTTKTCNTHYQRSTLVNKGKFSKLPVDIDSFDNVSTVIEMSRSLNTKVLVLSTKVENSDELVSPRFIEKIANNCPSLILVDDTFNAFTDKTYTDLVDKYKNIVVLKSFKLHNDLFDKNTSFIVGDGLLISHLKCLSHYLDFNIFNSASILLSLSKLNNEIIEMNYELEVIKSVAKKDFSIEQKVSSKEEKKEETIDKVEEKIEEVVEEKDLDTKTDIDIKTDIDTVVEFTRASLMEEACKFKFVSIFSSNSEHVYILTKVPIYPLLLENNIILKRYNASEGEILRLIIAHTKHNKKVLKILEEVASKLKPSQF